MNVVGRERKVGWKVVDEERGKKKSWQRASMLVDDVQSNYWFASGSVLSSAPLAMWQDQLIVATEAPPICLFHLPHFQIPFFISLYFDCTQRFSFSSTLDYVGCTSVLLLLYIVAAERSRSTFTITKGLEQEKIWAGYSKRLSSYNTHTPARKWLPITVFFLFFFRLT